MKKNLFLVLLFVSLSFLAGASGFTENKGQLRHKDGTPASEVLYYAYSGELAVFLREDGFSYVPLTASSSQAIRTEGRIDFTFRGNHRAQIESKNELPGFSNYYLPSCRNGIHGVKNYEWILYKNIFEGVDAEFFLPESGGFKYNFVLHPGVSISNILLDITGAEQQFISSQHLSLKCGDAIINENIPYSFFTTAEGKKSAMICDYVISKNPNSFQVQFSTSSDPLSAMRVIDPWATYCGGGNSDDLFAISMAPSGTLVTSGSTYSVDFPVSVGAMQDTLGGNYDAVVLRLDTSGQRLWSTYFGGSAYDNSYAATYSNGMLLVAGNAASTDLPVSAGAFQTTHAGSYDAYVLRLDDNGYRIWATYFGSNGGEQGISLATDRTGHFYLGGSSTSSTLPLVSSGFQTSNGGAIDAFVAKFDSTGIPYRCTYYGGASPEDVHVIRVDDSLNVLICGGTFSANFPVSPGCFQNVKNGTSDIYIVKFDSTLNRRFASYYGGIGTEDSYGIESDSAGNIYIAGFTQSFDFPMYGASWMNNIQGQTDLVMFRCDPTGMIEWSTYYGGVGDDYCYAMTRLNNHIYLTGMTGSADFPVSSNAAQDTLAAYNDAFWLKFDTAGTFVAGSFFGGQYGDQGNAITVDDSSTIYYCGSTMSADLPVTPNAMQTNFAFLGDGFIVSADASYALSGNETHENNFAEAWNVFPNPFADELNITGSQNIRSWQITDVCGRLVQRENISAATVNLKLNLVSGIYFLKITGEDGSSGVTRIVAR